MSNKELYEKVMKNKSLFNKVKNDQIYYYPYDYPFPNVNLIFYNENKKKYWIDRIKKLYYSHDLHKEWYNFYC